MKKFIYLLLLTCSITFGQQFARPSGDNTIGTWTGDPVNTTGNRYQNIDETTASDTDFIRSVNDPSSASAYFNLSPVTDPESNVNHIVRYRYRKGESGGGQPAVINLIVYLTTSANVTIAAQTHNDISTSYVDGSFTLSSLQADGITDYTTLKMRVSATKASGARTSWAEVSFYEFEVPNATASTSRTIIIN